MEIEEKTSSKQWERPWVHAQVIVQINDNLSFSLRGCLALCLTDTGQRCESTQRGIPLTGFV